KEPLSTTFNCLFCNHEDSVTCKLDKKAGIGQLQCKICGQQFQSNINYLSHAVDVYSEWVDACDEVAKPKSRPISSKQNESQRQSQTYPSASGAVSDLEDDEDDEEDMRIGQNRPTTIDDYDDDDE
ncbi:putative transcription elongation factor, partial [Geopyxis carbonaria]